MGVGRWFERTDGVIFRMDDPDHITRLLHEGWREVAVPGSVPRSPETPLTPDEIQARNDAARAAFRGAAPAHPTGRVKPIKSAKRQHREEEEGA